MENKQDGIALYDTLFTNNHICMLKLLLPMLPSSQQKSIAIYIKYLELQYTMQYFTRHPFGFYIPSTQNNEGPQDFNSLFDTLLPYCTPQEKEKFQQMRNTMNSFRNMQEMMEMMNMMKEMFPEGFAGFNAGEAFSNGCSGSGAGEAFSNGCSGSGAGAASPDLMSGLGSMLCGVDMSQIMNMMQMLRGGM